MHRRIYCLLAVGMMCCMLATSHSVSAQTSQVSQPSAVTTLAEETVASADTQQTPTVSQPVQAVALPSAKQVQTFNQLHMFSIGGLVVLFCLLTGTSVGGVWFLLLAVFMNQWGWLTFPDSLMWLQTPEVHKIIIFLLILNIVLSSGTVIDIVLILLMIWVVINGVFTDTPALGRWLVLVCTMFASAAGRFGIMFASFGAMAGGMGFIVKLARVFYTFVSLWIMSYWL